MIFTLLLAASAASQPTPQTPDCSYDRDAMLALGQTEFDQDMDGGWRPLASREGCEIAAAELIREWRHEKRNHASILYWHEGQMRAIGGQTRQAIALFELTFGPTHEDAGFGWNHYVDGTIAFLEGDRERLGAAMDRLKAIPEPSNNSYTRADGTVVKMSWPPNLNVLEGFERCWGQDYKVAYGPECTRPISL